MSLGKRLVEARENVRLNQKEAAKKIGINNTVLSRYEANERKPDPETLVKIADTYKVTADFLLGRSNYLHPINIEINIPPDIEGFVEKKENHELIRFIDKMKKKGYSDVVIIEWMNSLMNTLTDIRKNILTSGVTGPIWAKEDLLPESARGKYSEDEKKKILKSLEHNK